MARSKSAKKWARRTYKDTLDPRTRSFEYFEKSLLKFRRLLYAATEGIDQSMNDLVSSGKDWERDLEKQLGGLPSLEGFELNAPLEMDVVEDEENRTLEITADPRILTLMVKGFIAYGNDAIHLKVDLHNILIVAVWSTFEGYIQEILTEIYEKHPHLLASDRMLKTSDIVLAIDDVLDFLVVREIEDVGRKNLIELNGYLKARVNYQISKTHLDRMREAYLIRNIVAHTAGRVRASQRSALPSDVGVENGELRLDQEYVLGTMHCLEDCVIKFDDFVRKKYEIAETPRPFRTTANAN